MTATVTHDEFLAVFDEFTGTSTVKIDFWLGEAETNLSKNLLGEKFKLAAMLYAAHNMTMNKQAASSGGAASGIMASKSVGPVSKSYDTSSTSMSSAGTWNYSMYGQRLVQLWKGCMAGPKYIPGNNRFPVGLG